MEKRYQLNLGAFIFAENDEEAKRKADQIRIYINCLDDSNASVSELREASSFARKLGEKIN